MILVDTTNQTMSQTIISCLLLLFVLSKGSKILVTKPWADGEFDEDESLDTIESDGAMGNGRSLEGSQAVIQTVSIQR